MIHSGKGSLNDLCKQDRLKKQLFKYIKIILYYTFQVSLKHIEA